MDDGGGQFHQILYTVVEFVSLVVYIFIFFVLVRALKWAAFSACEPQTQTQTLQAAARVFHSNKWIFLEKNISINSKLKLFEATVTPIACFTAGHRSIRQHDFHILDVEFRRLVRSVVGNPSGVCWSSPWHEILHEWNARVQQILEGQQPRPQRLQVCTP